MNRYSYNGPVAVFGQIVDRNWSGKTTAVSEAKARSNLIFQWKKTHNYNAGSKVTLPGPITEGI